MQDSNLRPLAPKASAIPDYANSQCVTPNGFEPLTPSLKVRCSNQLSYEVIVVMDGLEPPTPTSSG